MKFYFDADADLSLIRDKVVGVVGYGNQGRAQSLNLRDSGLEVLIGNREDSYAERARLDNFEVCPINQVVSKADVIPILIPDEVQADVYKAEIAPNLRPGQVLCFAHGYNIHFGLIRPPADVDVILVAPRMIGVNVRVSFERGGGVPAFVGVSQDASANAWNIALAFAKGIGATRAGVISIGFREETELDLFNEQALWPILLRAILTSFDVLVKAGYPPEAVVMELYGSGEPAEVFAQMATKGLFRQMALHSQTSQYGTLTNYDKVNSAELEKHIKNALGRIRSGDFAREFAKEQSNGSVTFRELKHKALQHKLNEIEDRLRPLLESTSAAGGHG